MTRQRFCRSARVGLRPQALAVASNVATNSVINCQEQQSLTKYCVALYLAKALDSSSRKQVSRAMQKQLTLRVPKYLVRKTLSS